MSKHKSHIVAVTSDSANLASIGSYDSFIPFNNDAESFPFEANDVWVGPRAVLESDQNFKQVIPYVIVERDGKILTYKRTSNGGESRLHNLGSIGFGGHIDVQDVSISDNGQHIDLEATVANATQREMQEELRGNIVSFSAIGMILDESNDVGKVHIGIVMVAQVSGNDMVVSNEPDQIDLQGFKDVADLNVDEFESWSGIVIRHLKSQKARAIA